MPSRIALGALLALAVLPPFVAQAAGVMAGSFGMFAELDHYHIEAEVQTASSTERVAMRDLSPHLSQDASRMLRPADGYATSAGQVDLVVSGLGDLGRLLCEVRPDGLRVTVRLYRGPLGSRAPLHREVATRCGRAGARTP